MAHPPSRRVVLAAFHAVCPCGRFLTDLSPLETVLKAGGDPNVLDGRDPLLFAACYDPRVLRLLLAYGADPNVRNRKGEPTLCYAVRMGPEAALQILLEAGADPNVSDRQSTPLVHVLRSGRSLPMVQQLLEAGADPNGHGPKGDSPPLTAAIPLPREAAGPGVGDPDPLPRIRLLLEAGADPNGYDEEIGQTPFMLAAKYGYRPVLELLLAWGADPCQVDFHGFSALQWVTAFYDQPELVRYLLTLGLDPLQRDFHPSAPSTPIDAARFLRRTESLAVLEAAVAARGPT